MKCNAIFLFHEFVLYKLYIDGIVCFIHR
jgi:hypothetical protein